MTGIATQSSRSITRRCDGGWRRPAATLAKLSRHGMVATDVREIQTARKCACREAAAGHDREAALSRPPRAAARTVLQRRPGRPQRLRIAGDGAVIPAAPGRSQAARQGAVTAARLV